jgi:TonB family protein
VLDLEQIFVARDPVPRRPFALLSVLAHCGLLALIFAVAHMPRARIAEERYAVTMTTVSESSHIAFNPPAAKGRGRRLSVPRAQRPVPMESVPEVGATEGTASEKLQRQAREGATALVTDLKWRKLYGFSPGGYEIPSWISGDFPVISAAEVPPHFQQLLVVEITIDVDGSVAQATIVSGSVAPTIQHKVLSAILGFKYNPAKRGGTPIPSQLDLVVHIPS